MDLEEDYSEYDYDYIPELEHQASSKESKEYYPQDTMHHVSDQFQGNFSSPFSQQSRHSLPEN